VGLVPLGLPEAPTGALTAGGMTGARFPWRDPGEGEPAGAMGWVGRARRYAGLALLLIAQRAPVPGGDGSHPGRET